MEQLLRTIVFLSIILFFQTLNGRSVQLTSVSPSEILVGIPTNIHLSGYGFNVSEEYPHVLLQDTVSKEFYPYNLTIHSWESAEVQGVQFNMSKTLLLFFEDGNSGACFLVKIFSQPNIQQFHPNTTLVTGSDVITVLGHGFFAAPNIQIRLTLGNYTEMVPCTPVESNGQLGCTFVSPAMQGSFYYTTQYQSRVEEPEIALAMNGETFVRVDAYFAIKILPTFKVGYMFVGSLNDFGWTYSQNKARMAIDTKYGGVVMSSYAENVPEVDDAVFGMLLEFCKQQYDLVFAGSFNFIHGCYSASLHPYCNYFYNETSQNLTELKHSTYILHAGGYLQTPTLATVLARMYQMRYVSGLVAGLQMRKMASQRVGYLGAFPIPEVVRGLNAFVLGCRQVNPSCEVVVLWTSIWHDDNVENSAMKKLWFEDGCRVFSQHMSTMEYVKQVVANGGPSEEDIAAFQMANNLTDEDIRAYTAELDEEGFRIGYSGDMRSMIGDHVLTSMLFQWEPMIDYFISKIMHDDWEIDENGNGIDYWPGAEVDAATLTAFSPHVDSASQLIVNETWDKLRNQQFTVFCGHLKMNNGSSVPAIQPDFDGVYGAGLPNFIHQDTADHCDQEQVETGECCLTDYPGLKAQWFLLEGIVPAKQCLNPVSCTFGMVTHELKSTGMVYAHYVAPPATPPVRPLFKVLCNEEGVSPSPFEIEFEYFPQDAENYDAEDICYKIEWDTDSNFGAEDRDCNKGHLCLWLNHTQTLTLCTDLPSNSLSLCYLDKVSQLAEDTVYYLRVTMRVWSVFSEPSDAENCQTNKVKYPVGHSPVLQWVFRSLAFIGVVFAGLTVIFVVYNRHDKVIRVAGRYVCILELTGLILGFASSDLFLETPSPAICTSRITFLSFAFTLVYAPIFAKNRRASLVFHNKRLRRVQLNYKAIYAEVAMYLCWDCAILLLMGIFDPFTGGQLDLSSDDTHYSIVCRTRGITQTKTNIYLMLLLLIKIGLVLYGALISFQTRNIHSEFNESKHMGWCIYNICFTGLIVVPLIYFMEEPVIVLILQATSVLWICFVTWVGLFIPKMLKYHSKVFNYMNTTGRQHYAESCNKNFRNSGDFMKQSEELISASKLSSQYMGSLSLQSQLESIPENEGEKKNEESDVNM